MTISHYNQVCVFDEGDHKRPVTQKEIREVQVRPRRKHRTEKVI